MKSYLLKIRGGVEVDSQGKKAGKGPLIQEEKSATLGVSQDQYLFQPIGFDSYNLDTTGNVGRCLSTPSGGLNEHIPIVITESMGFCTEHSAKSRSIGAQEECSPTLRAGVIPAVAVGGANGIVQPITFEPGIASREGGHIYEGVSGTLRAKPGDNQLAVCYEVEMEVAKRKYEVDIERLKELLRSHKTMSNKEIAERLDQPLTLVEHWFRADKYFAIPQPEIWMQLKALLGIETDEFDRSIMEFEFVGGNYDMRNRIWGGETAPTLTQGCDDYLLVPKCYGISSYDSNAMKSSNPHSGIYEAETSRTLDHNGNNPACNQGGIVIIENHPADSRVNIDDSGTVQTLTSRMGTGGGNVPLVMYSKQRRAKFKGDFETWHESMVTNTMNTFDQGDVRATDVVVCGVDVYNQTVTGEKSRTLTSVRSDADHIPVICMATQQGNAEIGEDLSPTITASAGMSGNNQPIVCLGMVLDDITPKWSTGDKAFTTRGTDWKRNGGLCVVLEGGAANILHR